MTNEPTRILAIAQPPFCLDNGSPSALLEANRGTSETASDGAGSAEAEKLRHDLDPWLKSRVHRMKKTFGWTVAEFYSQTGGFRPSSLPVDKR